MLRKESKQRLNSSHNVKREEELARFDQMATAWWDPEGAFKHVLAFNQARLQVILAWLIEHFELPEAERSGDTLTPDLNGLRMLDIGCGGGLLSEALAALGAEVTGIDGSEVSIEVAKAHARQSGVVVDYQHKLAEELLDENWPPFDLVLNTEVIEHVEDQEGLVKTCCRLVKPSGLVILATLNRTLKSWLFGIVGAEYVLRLLPRGTHDWRYFVTPDELQSMLSSEQFKVRAIRGLSFNPLNKRWRTSQNASVNYLLAASMKQ